MHLKVKMYLLSINILIFSFSSSFFAAPVIDSDHIIAGSCGVKQGKCAEAGSCCSQNGFCGLTADYCGTGCQASFNYPGMLCTDPANSSPLPTFTPTPDEGYCGLNIGNCLTPGNCCSQYGYCGKTKAYCETGCQSSYNYPGVKCKSEKPKNKN